MPHKLIVTPLHQELEFLVQALCIQGYVAEAADVGRLRTIRFPELSLAIAHAGHGKAQSAVQTQYLLDRFDEVDRVICVGAAGCLHPDLQVGDLVIGTQTIEHDYCLRFVQKPLPVFENDKPTVQSFKKIVERSKFEFGVHFGAIASGDEDVVSSERAADLAKQTQALCVAWEGAGVARACAFNQVAFVEIRCITDKADKTAPTDFEQNLERSLVNLSQLLIAENSDKGNG